MRTQIKIRTLVWCRNFALWISILVNAAVSVVPESLVHLLIDCRSAQLYQYVSNSLLPGPSASLSLDLSLLSRARTRLVDFLADQQQRFASRSAHCPDTRPILLVCYGSSLLQSVQLSQCLISRCRIQQPTILAVHSLASQKQLNRSSNRRRYGSIG